MLLEVKLNFVQSTYSPPPGNFKQSDLQARRRLENSAHRQKFLCPWRKRLLLTLQSRTKWKKIKRNFRNSNIVLLRTNTTRNQWLIAKVVHAYKGNDSHVRTFKLRVGDYQKFLTMAQKICLV